VPFEEGEEEEEEEEEEQEEQEIVEGASDPWRLSP
jgi:hypothetical protein